MVVVSYITVRLSILLHAAAVQYDVIESLRYGDKIGGSTAGYVLQANSKSLWVFIYILVPILQRQAGREEQHRVTYDASSEVENG